MSEKTYDVGIVGAGWVSGEHIKAFQKNPHSRVAAITSRTEEKARAKAKEHNLRCNTYSDYDKMLEKESLDIVVVCTPHHLHADQTVKAVEAGKHVLIEKPMAINLEDLARERDAVRKHRVRTLVSFVLRWNPFFETVKKLLSDDALGKIYYAEADYISAVGKWYSGYKWIRTRSMGGSALLAAGCHAVDALRWFVGDVVEVTAYPGGYRKDLEYNGTTLAMLRFKNGAIGKVSANFDCVLPYTFNLELFGDKGTIRNNKLYSPWKFPGQTEPIEIPTVMPDTAEVTHHPFEAEINHFVGCIMTGKESHANVEDTVKTHEICLAADISAEEHRPVQLPLI